jgi:hypothetical protein
MHLPCSVLGGLHPPTKELNQCHRRVLQVDYNRLLCWAGTKDLHYQPNPWFSTCHILSGSALIAILLTRAGDNVKEDASTNMFKAMRRREDYERKMRRENPLPGWVNAFVWYNAAYLITIVLWMAWMGFIVGWSIVVTWNIVDEGQ